MQDYVAGLDSRRLWKLILWAGLAGGLAEIAWIGANTVLAPGSMVELARQITATFYAQWAQAPFAPVLGLVIHLALSVVLGAAFGVVVWAPLSRRLEPAATMMSAMVAMAGIWALNFFFVLPALNPAIVALVPYTASLAAQAAFGIAMALIFMRAQVHYERTIGGP